MANIESNRGNIPPSSSRPYRPGTHWLMEQVSHQATSNMRRENINMLVAKYGDDCNILRAGVLRKLRQHTGNTDGLSWAMFGYGSEATSGNTLVEDHPTNVFVYTQRYPGDRKVAGHAVPFLRIITNEKIVAEDGRVSVLCKDFSLLANNAAFYHVGAVSEFSAADSQMVPEEEIIIPSSRYTRHDAVTTDWQSVAAEVHIDSEGKIRIRPTVENVTPLLSVADYQGAAVTPFGDNTSFEDYVHALAEGEQLFSMVSNLDPTLARGQ